MARALAMLLAGCAATLPPPLPSQGGPRWLELTSDHFVLWTDLPADAARAALDDVEDFRGAVLASAFGGADAPGRTLIVGVRSYAEWTYLGEDRRRVGLFLGAEGSPLRLPVVAFSGEVPNTGSRHGFLNEGMDGTTTLRHEVAHAVTAR